MVIKAKNTITLVRTDDGLPAYVHNAWSNSPDGTVDFTTVYPGENLYSDTQYFNDSTKWNNYSSWIKEDKAYNNLTVMSTLNDWNGIHQGIAVKAGETYSFSLYVKYETGSGISRVFYNYNTENIVDKSYEPFNITNNWQRISSTVNVVSDGIIRARIERTNNNTNKLLIAGLKLEKNNISTLYTPSPTDDPIGAYPKYMGTCSNHSETAPTDPSAYEWARILGPGAYTYTAWADNITGTVGFVTDETLGKNKKYRGIYNKNVDIPDRNDPAQYRWDWTPSPDELVSTIDWQAKTSQYDMALEPDNITASVTTSKSWSKFKQDEIDSKASKADLERAEHTLTNVGDMLEATQKQVGAMQMQSDKFEVSLKETTQAVTDQGTYVYEMLNYMQFAADGLTIGQGNSPFKMKLTNEKLAFLQDGIELARFSGRELQVKTVRVEQDLFLGNHRVKADTTSGQTIIYWVGGAAK